MHQMATPPMVTEAAMRRTLGLLENVPTIGMRRIDSILVKQSPMRRPPVDQFQRRQRAEPTDEVAQHHEAAMDCPGHDLPLVLSEQLLGRLRHRRVLGAAGERFADVEIRRGGRVWAMTAEWGSNKNGAATAGVWVCRPGVLFFKTSGKQAQEQCRGPTMWGGMGGGGEPRMPRRENGAEYGTRNDSAQKSTEKKREGNTSFTYGP